ncbi:MAG: DUF6268 family outer membrane beta-barrel protein [Crocinitomicaceae bacterium]
MRLLLVVLISFWWTNSFGQNWVDLANVYWRTSPASDFDNIGDYKRNFNMYVVDAKAPVVLGDNNVLIFGLEYQYNSITSNTPLYSDYYFTSIMLQLGWEHNWNDKSKMLFMAIPRLQTDFNDVGISHFQMGGIALGTTKRSERFDWRYGLYYNGEFFGPMFVPLFGFNWKMNEKWLLRVVVPLNLELAFVPGTKFRTGLRFDGVNASYMYQFNSGTPFATNRYIDKADNNVWLFGEFTPGANLWFHFRAGHSVLRKYRFFTPGDKMDVKLGPVNIGDDRNFDDPKAVPLQLKNGWSFEARMIYRLPLK